MTACPTILSKCIRNTAISDTVLGSDYVTQVKIIDRIGSELRVEQNAKVSENSGSYILHFCCQTDVDRGHGEARVNVNRH